MKIIITAYYEFLKNLRDIKILIILVALPILTTFILGTAVKTFFSSDSSSKISVGYVNQDNEAIGKAFDSFLENGEINKRLNIIDYSSKNEAEKGLKAEKIDAIIYVPEGISDNLLKGEKGAIEVSGKKNVELLESIVSSFTNSYNATNLALISGGTLKNIKGDSNINRIYYSSQGKVPSSMDYYAVLTLLEMLVIGGVFGVFISTKEYGSDMHIRANSLPIKIGTIIWGKIIGSTLFLFSIGIIDILLTKVLFNANWQGNPFIIAAAILLFSSIVIGIGTLLGFLVRSFSTSLMIIIMIMTLFGTLSGSVSPVYTIDAISFLIPNYNAKVLLFGTLYGYPQEIMLQAALCLIISAVAIYILVAVAIRRSRYENI